MQESTNRAGEAAMLRPIDIVYDALGYADASVLFSLGKTKVLANVTLTTGVPAFLKGKKTGWLTAEYAMLPCATQQRTAREISQANRNYRGIEISRLIGRSLRTVVDLAALGERTITVDCDVLHADGSTRVASITAASLALQVAAARWCMRGILATNVCLGQLVALSAGMVDAKPRLDLCFDQDSKAESDFNFVLTTQGAIVEIQGTAERTPMSWEQFDVLKHAVLSGCADMVQALEHFVHPDVIKARELGFRSSGEQVAQKSGNQKQAIFSLGNRLQQMR